MKISGAQRTQRAHEEHKDCAIHNGSVVLFVLHSLARRIKSIKLNSYLWLNIATDALKVPVHPWQYLFRAKAH